MGSHPGTFNIDRDDEAMTIKGEAIVKIIKNIHYPFETGTYEPHEDGSVHYNAKLKSAFGNGTLDADFDIDKDGNISGGAKGILTWDGKATNWGLRACSFSSLPLSAGMRYDIFSLERPAGHRPWAGRSQQLEKRK